MALSFFAGFVQIKNGFVQILLCHCYKGAGVAPLPPVMHLSRNALREELVF